MTREQGHARRAAMRSTLVLLLPLLACTDDPSAPPDPRDYPVTLTPTAQWAGNDIELRWGYLAQETPSSFFLTPPSGWSSSRDQVRFSRTSDSTGILTTARDRAGGQAQLHAVLGGGDTVEVGGVLIGGPTSFAGFTSFPIELECPSYPWPRSAPTKLLGCLDGSIVTISTADAVVQEVGPTGGLLAWNDGFGVSYRPTVFLAPLGPDSVIAWDTEADAEAGRYQLAHGGNRAIELAPDLWVLVTAEGLEQPGSADAFIPAPSTGKILFNPDGQTAVFLAAPDYLSAALASPVLRTGDGSLHHRLPAMGRIMGAEFTAGGNRLLVAGMSTFGSTIVLALGRDGEVLLSGGPYATLPLDLVVDAAAGRAYVPGEMGDGDYVSVLDLGTLAEVALVNGYGGGFCGTCLEGAGSVIADGRGALHFTIGFFTKTYTLLP